MVCVVVVAQVVGVAARVFECFDALLVGEVGLYLG